MQSLNVNKYLNNKLEDDHCNNIEFDDMYLTYDPDQTFEDIYRKMLSDVEGLLGPLLDELFF